MATYDTVVLNSLLVPQYRFVAHKKPHQLLAPLLVTAGQQEESVVASKVLEHDAFDVIVKSIVPQEALQTIRLALWQNRLLTVLASKERVLSRFQQHMVTYPDDLKAEAHFRSNYELIDSTFRAIQASMRLMVSIEEENPFFDMAAAVEGFTRKRALSRLSTLSADSTPR